MFLFQYSTTKNFLHNIKATYKFVLLILFPILFFINFYFAYFIIFINIILCFKLKIINKIFFKQTKFFFLLIFLIFFIRSFTFESLYITFSENESIAAVRLIAKILATFLTTILFFATTTIFELKTSLMRVESFIVNKSTKRQPRILIFSLIISLVLSFIPQFFYFYNEAYYAYKIRNINITFYARVKQTTQIFLLVFEKLLYKAKDTIDAIVIRES